MVNARRGVPPNRALPNSPDRRPRASGNAILTRNARASASTARLTSTTVPVIEVVPVPRKTGTLSPFRISPMRDSSTRTSRRNPRVSSRRRRGMPGDAMFPGSTIFSVIRPSKGAAIVVKEPVVLAWSPAARALSTANAACNARADAPATRASALRSVAVASSSSCAVADRLACRPAMRSWDARARARPASAARSSAAAAFAPCSAARAAERAARAPAARSSPSSTMSVWPSRT